MNINANDAIVVAFFTTIISFIIQFFFRWYDGKNIANSFELSVIAEIEAMLSIIKKREYREALESGIQFSYLGSNIASLQIDIQENYCPIYYSNLDKISLLSKKRVKDIVWFYSILASIIQDVKPNGILNTDEVSKEAFIECLKLLDEAIAIGNRIIK